MKCGSQTNAEVKHKINENVGATVTTAFLSITPLWPVSAEKLCLCFIIFVIAIENCYIAAKNVLIYV